MANWEAATALSGVAAVAGSIVAFVLRPINKRLDSHSKRLADVDQWRLRTAEAMSRTVAILDQMEKRVTRIEAHDDAIG